MNKRNLIILLSLILVGAFLASACAHKLLNRPL
jgi:hypothetical protein